MTALRIARRLGVCAVLACAVSIPAAVASGSADTGTFPILNDFVDTVDVSDTCLGPNGVGTLTGHEEGLGHFTENGPPAFGFHAHGSSTITYRVDFGDGRYVIGVSYQRFAFNSDRIQTDSHSGRDVAALYGPGGDLIGPVAIHENAHATYIDVNHDNEPDAGDVIRTDFDNFRIDCR